MTTLEGWPYRDHPKRGKDLQSRYTKAEADYVRAEARMRRAIHAWEKARATFHRRIRALEKEDPT